jgi:hypothetical protein
MQAFFVPLGDFFVFWELPVRPNPRAALAAGGEES